MAPTDASTPPRSHGFAGDVDFSIRLARQPIAGRRARQAVTRGLGQLLADRTLDDVLLATSELVTNAVLYGAGEIEMRMHFDGMIVRGDVIDGGKGFDRPVHGHPGVVGHGLYLVDRLSEAWGMHQGTTHVWFEIRAAGIPSTTCSDGRLGVK